MEDNRKIKTGLAVTGAFILVVLLGYTEMKEKINAYRKQDISLEQEQTIGTRQEIEEQLESEEVKSAEGEGTVYQEEAGALEDADLELPEVAFLLEGYSDIKISMWQSDAGICYFFLPGFAKDRSLVLESAEGGKIQLGNTVMKEGDVLKGVEPDEAYAFTLFDKSGDALLKAPAVFMYSSDLPVLCMTTVSGKMTKIDEEKGSEEAGRAVLFDETGAEVYSGDAERIGGRGNSTWGLAKKPYQFKLCEKADFFGFGEAKAWNLLANGYDETRLRNKITLDLASALGMAYVPEGRMVDLYINDIYYGNYFLTEKIRVGEESVAIRDMETVTDAAYSPEEKEKLKRFQNEDGTRKWTETVYEETDISGGYLFERELPGRFEDEVSGFITDQGDCYALQSPVYASEEQVNYIADLMQEFQDAVEETDGIHPLTGKHYSEYIDITSFVQKYLVEEITKNYDGGVTSSFFYKPQDAVSNKIFAGPVWDYDVAFGNCNLDEIAGNPAGLTKLSDHVYGTDVFAGLYEKEDFYEQVKMMYQEKALPYLDYLLEEGIDLLTEESRASAQMDSIRWENLENRYQYYEEYDNDIRYLKYFIEQRKNFLNEVWMEDVIYHNVTFMVDGEAWQIICVKDGEMPGNEPIPSRYSSLFMGWVTENNVPFDRFKPIYEDMTFYSTWQELPVEEVILN